MLDFINKSLIRLRRHISHVNNKPANELFLFLSLCFFDVPSFLFSIYFLVIGPAEEKFLGLHYFRFYEGIINYRW